MGIHVASRVCLRLVTDVDEVIDCEEMAEGLGNVPASDWKILEKVNLDNVLDSVERIYSKSELEELISKKGTTSSTIKAVAKAQAAAAEKEKEKEKKKLWETA